MLFKKQSISTDAAKIEEILTRGVEDIFVKESLEKKLKSGKQLRIKLGFDPTGSKIHIGRAIVLRKLRALQDLGHKVVFLVGDFTAQIGDPSDKLDKRPMLSAAQITENLKDYKRQVGLIIDLSKAEFHFNSSWLKKLSFADTVKLAESFTVQQMLARRNFKDRYDRGSEISLREFLYPLMQGYDSVALKADIELGGFDQLFNLKAGRIIQKYYGQIEQDVLTVQMLEGTDGRKMSTSWGNVINITDTARDMFGKVMSVRDDLVKKYFLLTTNVPMSEIEAAASGDPREVKLRLAREVTRLYHGEEETRDAEEYFVKVFSNKEMPDDVLEVFASVGTSLQNVVLDQKLLTSKSEWRRTVEQGGVLNFDTNEKITDKDVVVTKDVTVRIGKRKFVKIKIAPLR